MVPGHGFISAHFDDHFTPLAQVLGAHLFVKQRKIFFFDHFEMMNLMTDHGEAHRQHRNLVPPIDAGVEQCVIVKTFVQRFGPQPQCLQLLDQRIDCPCVGQRVFREQVLVNALRN
jgi:hypothetical protein